MYVFSVFVCKLRHNNLLYRLTDSSLSTVEKIRCDIKLRHRGSAR